VGKDIQRPLSCPAEGQIPSFDAGWNAHKVGISRKTVEVLSPPMVPGVKSWGVYAWDIRDQLATEARREYARKPIPASAWGPKGAMPTFLHPTDQGPPDESYGFTAYKVRWETAMEQAEAYKRQLEAVDKALGPWEADPESEVGCVGRVQTIQNLKAERERLYRIQPLINALTEKLGWALFNLGKGKPNAVKNLIIGAERIVDEIRGTDYAYIWEHGCQREDDE